MAEQVLEVNLSREFETLELYAVGDLHYGSILCNEVKWHNFVRMILDKPNRYIIGCGDYINNNLAGAVGSVWEDKCTPRDQRKLVKKELESIKDRILVMVDGNHDRRGKKINDENPAEDIAESLNIPFREDDCFIKLRFGTNLHNKPQAYSIYITHGSGGGKRPGSSLNNLELLSLSAFSEIYVMGHHHKKTAHKAIVRVPDLRNNNVMNVEQLYVISSSYQDFGGYAKQKMLRPSSLGSVPITLYAKEKRYEATI